MEKFLFAILCFYLIFKYSKCYVVKRSVISDINLRSLMLNRKPAVITEQGVLLTKTTNTVSRLITRNPSGITPPRKQYVDYRRHSKQATLFVCIGFIPGIAFFFVFCRYVPDWCADRFQ